jgi:hypothetical protein
MLTPGARKLVRAFFGDQKSWRRVAATFSRSLFLPRLDMTTDSWHHPAITPAARRSANLRRELLDFSDAMGDENGIVRDALEQGGGAGVHGQYRGFEAGFPADIEIL